MRITIAALTLSASLAIGGILGTTAEVRAELVTELVADTIVDASADVTAATTHGPAGLDVRARRPGDDEQASENKAAVANSAPELLARDRPRPGPESLIPDGAQAGPRQLAQVQNAIMNEDWTWNLDFKESVRPLYEELAAAGVVDAVSGLRSYLELSAASPYDAPAMGAYGGLPESASWENPSANPGHQQAAVRQSDKEKLLSEIMIKEFIEAAEPWVFGLAAVYVLWQGTRLWLDYSRWRTTRAQKRGARAKRRRHDAPPGAQVKSQLSRHRRLLR